MSYVVSCADDGSRLDRFLKRQNLLPYTLIQKGFRRGLILVNERVACGSDILHGGDKIFFKGGLVPRTCYRPVGGAPASLLLLLKKSIIQNTQDYIVFNKPRGLAVQQGPQQTYSLDRLVPLLDSEGTQDVKVVHRLDKNTSGCFIMARNRQMAQCLAQQFRQRSIKKIYCCLCAGAPSKQEGFIDHPLQKKRLLSDGATRSRSVSCNILPCADLQSRV